MVSWHQALYHLQEVDHRIVALKARDVEIEAGLKDHAKLSAAQEHHAASRAAADGARRRQQELEFELSRVQARLIQTEERLYGGRVTNARELQDLQAEAESLKRHRSTLEDQVLEAMVEREDADSTLKEAERALKTAEAEAETSAALLTAEQAALHGEQATLATELEALRHAVPPAVLDSYDYLKPRTAGIPVAMVKNDVCGICGTEIMANTLRKLRKGEEATCDACRRLLVQEP